MDIPGVTIQGSIQFFTDTEEDALQGTVIAVSLEEDTTASCTGLSLPAIRAHARKSYLVFLNRIGPK
jgi:hypothetical protein